MLFRHEHLFFFDEFGVLRNGTSVIKYFHYERHELTWCWKSDLLLHFRTLFHFKKMRKFLANYRRNPRTRRSEECPFFKHFGKCCNFALVDSFVNVILFCTEKLKRFRSEPFGLPHK